MSEELMELKMEPAGLTAQYLENRQKIGTLETMNQAIKDNLSLLLPYNDQHPAHEFESGRFEWVKGRTTHKLDEKKLRLHLATEGVDLSLIEKCFEKATTVTVGAPTTRITGPGAGKVIE